MKIRKLLFAVKFGELDLEAIKSLLDLKQAGLDTILLTHIIPRDEVAFVPYGGYRKDEEQRFREEARIRFADWEDDIRKAGVGVKVLIEVGDPVPEIMNLAEAEQVDLIVTGRDKRTGLEKVFEGSHTLELLRRNRKIPILVTKHSVSGDIEEEHARCLNENPFCRPLLATDWSPPSERAFQSLLDLRGVVRKVDVAHVIAIKISKDHDIPEWHRIEAESKDRLNRCCDLLEKAGIECESHLAAGNTASEIQRLSRELRSTMTVLGTTGKDRVHALLLGSLSQRIAESSELPTLLVP